MYKFIAKNLDFWPAEKSFDIDSSEIIYDCLKKFYPAVKL